MLDHLSGDLRNNRVISSTWFIFGGAVVSSVNDKIRDVIRAGGNLPVDIGALGDSDDLYAAGLTSHATVNLMLGLEEKFDIEFPDRLLRRRTFESVAAIAAAIGELLGEKVAA
jgi:acyl carrier protein